MFEDFDLLSFLAGFAGGVAITFVSVSIRKSLSASRNATAVDQSKAQAGGDIVGRDKK